MEAHLAVKPRVRFAPSPTGHFHIGGARTMLFNIAFARKLGGTVILRSEDTDKARSLPEYERELVEVMQWLGLTWDEGIMLEGGVLVSKGEYGPYRQSERTEMYKKYLTQLIEQGKAYYCYCTKEDLAAQEQLQAADGLPKKYPGHCRFLKEAPAGKTAQVIRFMTPEVIVKHHDLVRDSVSFDAGLFGDFVIAKDIETPLYNLAAVVDDYTMKITHVIRGEEHISNTPKQILMAEALGFTVPRFAHLPLILAENRSKMSKRYMETSLLSYREKGYLPEAIVNFLALLGWHPSGDNEVFSLAEFTELFDMDRVQKAGAIFNEEKLEWLNGEYIKKLSDDELVERVEPFLKARNVSASPELVRKVVLAQRTRAKTLGEIVDLGDFFFHTSSYESHLLNWKDASVTQTKETLVALEKLFESLTDADFERNRLIACLQPIVDEKGGRGPVYWPLRVALSGKEKSPDPLEIAEILGKEESLKRIRDGIRNIGESK